MNKRKFWVMSASKIPAKTTGTGWDIWSLSKDYPGFMGQVASYYSLLDPGAIPHEIHTHHEEEMFVLLTGTLNKIYPNHIERIEAGGCVYLAPGSAHTMQSVGPEKATFFVFKWSWEAQQPIHLPQDHLTFLPHQLSAWDDEPKIQIKPIWQNHPLANGSSLTLNKIRVSPHTGVSPHTHEFDLLLILQKGEIHGFGHTTSAPAVIYYPAGTIHAVLPHCSDTIEMLEFQFHKPKLSEF